MRSVRSQHTAPELTVRQTTTALGYRYRLHKSTLPGKPDLVFASRRKAIFVHGCFWHGHDCKRGAREPKTNTKYWSAKIQSNKERDSTVIARLNEMDWKILIVWECETRNLDELRNRIKQFLG
jgi:DNA mismatch endonuclease (patch repair protein)